ncbi:unnamed protein product [Fraxinus pennsylvanica]|uniref:Peptidase metallopeptidase domain-containing protein n=1 Tax=Fraxinus pennsylvanica TaxID=56036 RepID=A0AAD2A7L8_9LAMI|nr:unnamed protein product [Fraxinus pennsylvanica]
MAFKFSPLFSCLFLFTLAIPALSHRKIKGHNDGQTSGFEFLKDLQGSHKGKKTDGLHRLKNYLETFGYLSYPYYKNENSDDFDDALESAIRTYQINYDIKATGILDAETVSKMMTPRCGTPDIVNGTSRMRAGGIDHTHHGSNSIHTVSHYSFFRGNPRWPASKRHLTYAFEANTPAAAIGPVARAFGTWASVTHFTFSQVQSTAAADIVIGFHRRNHGDGVPFDGPGGVIAHAFAPTDGRFHYDADNRFSVGAAAGASDLETVALHEIGHLLGLHHSSVENAIMFAFIPTGATKGLDADDIQGIRALYNI